MPESNDVAPNGSDGFRSGERLSDAEHAHALVTRDDSDIRLIDVKTSAISATFGTANIPDLKIALPVN